MAVTTTRTNKPINPRGNDQSPKGYNRAALYSGKALDFDGVNDYVDLDGFTLSGTTATFSFAFNSDDLSVLRYFFDASDTRFIIGSGNTANYLTLYTPTSSFQDIVEVQTGEWYKLDISINGTSAVCYLNGVLVNTLTIGEIDLSAATLAKFGSARNGAGLFYNGQASNFKIFNTALTAAQVADLYNNPEKVVPTGVDNTALKLWLPMQEGAGTYCINGADPLGDDEYNGAGSFDSATGWTLNTGFSIGGGSLSCDGSQTAATSAYYNISSVASSLVMVQFTLSNVTAGQVQLAFFGASGTTTKWYTADGTYTEYVEVAAGHNGNTGFIANADFVGDIDNLTLKVVNTGDISGASWTHGIGAPVAQTAVIDWNKETTGAGTTMLLPQGLTSGRDITGVNLFENVRKQGALNLDGNSWAEVHDNASFDFGTGSFTLEAWAKVKFVAQGSSVNCVFGLGGTISSGSSFIFVTNSNAPSFYYGTSGSTAFAKTEGDWVHIVGVYDETNATIYINATQEDQDARTATTMTNDLVKMIGRDSTTFRYYNDQIAQPRIYNRALTAEEIERNYNTGKNIYTN